VDQHEVQIAPGQRPTTSLGQWANTAVILTAAAAFGGVDQYIGSLYSPFATAVSLMSAPWLLLPFAAGAFQVTWRRAAWLGYAATWLAVGAYMLMIDSPMEGVHPTLRVVMGTVYSQWIWLAGGAVSGPAYGLLGYLWRARRSWICAALAALPVMFEPVVQRLGVRPSPFAPAGYAEAAAGLALAGIFACLIVRGRRAAAVEP
jgi:hypothetical protein